MKNSDDKQRQLYLPDFTKSQTQSARAAATYKNGNSLICMDERIKDLRKEVAKPKNINNINR